MKGNSVLKRIELHKDFWNRLELQRPLIAFEVGGGFFNSQFKAGKYLFIKGKKIEPNMIDVDLFLEEYEQMYKKASMIEQDAFWTAEPFSAIPWMEAILGCEIFGTTSSLISHTLVKSVEDLEKITLDIDNLWFLKFIEFHKKLNKLSAGRFPVGQPLMRGPFDVVGALLGQTELIYALHDEYPEKMKKILLKVSDIFLNIIGHQYKIISDFYGGYPIGLYDLWTPGRCIWYQDDLSALLSPSYYRDFLREPEENICKNYQYTVMHLHPVSLFIIDELLKIEELKVIEVNKDLQEPTIKDMIPTFKKILHHKNLIISGKLNKEDIGCILNELSPKGIFLQIITHSMESAKELMDFIQGKN
ncbi:MAG: hypothetical protein ACYDIA_04235 [Candidatus Humimicrobiaceae bacterium]